MSVEGLTPDEKKALSYHWERCYRDPPYDWYAFKIPKMLQIVPPLPPPVPAIFKLPFELLLMIFRAGSIEERFSLALTCKRLLAIASDKTITILIPSAVRHRLTKFWPYCDAPFIVLVTSQQLDSAGKPVRPEIPCCRCLRFRSTDKTFWIKKGAQYSKTISADPVGSRYGAKLYDYLVENWCTAEQPFNEESIWDNFWAGECHDCLGNGSSARPCPDCALELRIGFYHEDPDCKSLAWLDKSNHVFASSWNCVPMNGESTSQTIRDLRKRHGSGWFRKGPPEHIFQDVRRRAPEKGSDYLANSGSILF
ncbi:hypothetical protein F5X97DRAFT_247830 [Nemania serpens]|nr:hypothetical protein F5X97DRAFT_247830 [Nemania serpens]